MPKKTALETADASPLEKLKQQMGPRLADVATEHLTPERLLRLFGAHAAGDQALQRCSVQSLAAALLLSSQLGLEPGGPLGHLYLVPYKTTCTPIIGYKGMLQLIRNTGEVRRINARVFYRQELDSGDIEISMEPPDVTHRWTGETYADDDIAGAYCIVEGNSGERYLETVTRREIDDRRKRSAAGNSGPWKTDFAAMARKCVVRKLFGGGTVPISAEKMGAISMAMESDGDSGNGKPLTRAARRVQMFRAEDNHNATPEQVADSRAVDVPAEVVGEDTPYTLAIRTAREMGATDADIDTAFSESGVTTLPADFTTADGKLMLHSLGRIRGA